MFFYDDFASGETQVKILNILRVNLNVKTTKFICKVCIPIQETNQSIKQN
jgi:hypothetical protein